MRLTGCPDGNPSPRLFLRVRCSGAQQVRPVLHVDRGAPFALERLYLCNDSGAVRFATNCADHMENVSPRALSSAIPSARKIARWLATNCENFEQNHLSPRD